MINPVAGPTSHDPKALLQLMKMMRGGSVIDERVFPKNTVTSDVNSDMAREVQTALSAPNRGLYRERQDYDRCTYHRNKQRQ
jgi:hypothetical protein